MLLRGFELMNTRSLQDQWKVNIKCYTNYWLCLVKKDSSYVMLLNVLSIIQSPIPGIHLSIVLYHPFSS